MVSKLYSRQKLDTNVSVLVDPKQPIMELSIYRLFKIDLVTLIKNKVALVKNFYIQPSEIEKMAFWEYEYFMEEVNDYIKKENERNEQENKKYGNMDPKSMMKSAQGSMPKMPSGGGMPKMPSMPKM